MSDDKKLFEEIKRQNDEIIRNQNKILENQKKNEKDPFVEMQEVYYKTPRSGLT
jgi:hypothetical protein